MAPKPTQTQTPNHPENRDLECTEVWNRALWAKSSKGGIYTYNATFAFKLEMNVNATWHPISKALVSYYFDQKTSSINKNATTKTVLLFIIIIL